MKPAPPLKKHLLFFSNTSDTNLILKAIKDPFSSCNTFDHIVRYHTDGFAKAIHHIIKRVEYSFLNPIERICFQICSMGFISGVYGGMERSCIFSGQRNAFDLCHAAPSHTNRIISSGYCSESFSRNILVHSVSQFGIVKKKLSPLRGSTAPNA